MRYVLIFWMFFMVTTLSGQSSTGDLMELSEDYEKYGLKEGNRPEKWEDGMRTDGGKKTYEWWYFDSHLDDGTTIVIGFYTKPFSEVNKKQNPLVTLMIDRPDGTIIRKEYFSKKETASFSKDSCHVIIGKNYFIGNLDHYEIHYEDEDLNLTATIERTAESWRPKTGHVFFGEEKDLFFAWVVPVPQGKTEIVYTYKDEEVVLKGSCYHDHNWGNEDMVKLFNHWYWSRAEIGPYSVIASQMIAEKDYNSENVVVFNVSKNGKVVADKGEFVTLYRTHGKMHTELKKDVSEDLVFIYDNPNDPYRYEYYLSKEKYIAEVDLLALAVPGKFLRCLARMVTGFDGAYFRFLGKAKIKVFKDDEFVESHESSKAVWELMYFGKPNGKK